MAKKENSWFGAAAGAFFGGLFWGAWHGFENLQFIAVAWVFAIGCLIAGIVGLFNKNEQQDEDTDRKDADR